MRTAPIGVYFAHTVKHAQLGTLVEAAIADSLITHADPRCAIACAAFDAAIAAGLMTPAPNPHAQLELARTVIPLATAKLRELFADDRDDLAAVDSAADDLQRDLDAAVSPNPQLYGPELDLQRMAGFVRVAFRLAFWHLVHTPSWRDAVIDVASRGADADTNAAITGALLGARDGITAIPQAWVDRVLAVTQPGPADWADAHHPRHLLALAAAAQ
jgi:ADP-ribosylglycohydrolase